MNSTNKDSKTNGDSSGVDCELLHRTSWTNASLALYEINKGRAKGNRGALWLRSKIQNELFHLGRFIQCHAGKVLFVGCLLLSTFCVGLKSIAMENEVEKLWVEEGGRLQKELEYLAKTLGRGAGSSSEVVIQTPSDESGNILSSEALIFHLEVLRDASRVSVDIDDVSWRLKDLCYAPTIPITEIQMIDQILENLFPCAIITPLDCFWEGSKLLERPNSPVHVPFGDREEGSLLLSWTSLNPLLLLRRMTSFDKYFNKHFNLESLEDIMKRAGIQSGYVEKPCLDPHDSECPATAPNKASKERPNIGAELTGGCYGFATRYMHWPESLVVGGVKKNRTGHIVRAKGLQSVVQLMGKKDLFNFWSETYKIHTLDWSESMAGVILSKWQSKFAERVQKLTREKSRKYKMNAFSSFHLERIMEEFSDISIPKVIIGYILMILYGGFTLFRLNDVVRSQAGLGIGGVLLVTLTVASGLGISALLGIPFNATTTQIIPFLALGLGVDSMFLLVHNYAEGTKSENPSEDLIAQVLRQSGVSVFLTAACNIGAFMAGALIPLPALRAFAYQASILVACNLFTNLFIFPSLMSLDLKRIKASHVDVFFCYPAKKSNCKCLTSLEAQSLNSSLQKCKHCSESWTLDSFAANYYGHWISKTPVKLITLVICSILTGGGLYGLTKMENGLDLTEIVPRNTSIHSFLLSQEKYFGFYNMYAVSMGNFEYPQNQKILYDYHNSFVRVSNIIKNDDGGLPDFWLSLFRNWLLRLQTAFDTDMTEGNISEKYGVSENASTDGILAFKLLVQTGHVDLPIDTSLVSSNRLVNSHGIINPSAFYNYLSAWYSNDAMAYSFSQASLVPTPKEWFHDPRDSNFKIPKSQAITLARIPFYLSNLKDTDVMVETILSIRSICSKFENEGLPNFPSGIPFTFWEQYVHLRFWLLVSMISILTAVFFIVAFVFMNLWLALIVIVVLGSITLQLFGAMGLLGIKLSAVPAVIAIISVGIGIEFTLHICIGFITSIGNKNRRVYLSLKHNFTPVVHGALSTFLGIIMLALSHFDFVVKYFFLVLTALLILGLFNGLVFLPVLLLLMGPPAEVIPENEQDFMTFSKPETKPKESLPPTPRKKKKPIPSHHKSDLSLSTIAEESNSYHSESSSPSPCTSVIVEPHVVVETTTYPMSESPSYSGSHQVTKVMASAKFKVEVHSTMTTPRAKSNKRSRNVDSSTESSSTSSTTSEKDLGFSEK